MNGLTVVSDAEYLAEEAVRRVVARGSAAVEERGRFVVALAGGSTPKATYRRLAEETRVGRRHDADRIDWSRTEVFWGDERCVPPTDPDSNYRMARETLLDHVDIPAERVHRVRGEIPPAEGAAAYRRELASVLGEQGRFDLILLGLGSDGHTASLFPGTPVVEERDKSAVAVFVQKLASWRITLTLPVINRARHVFFLVSGARKAEALARVQAGERLPAAFVRPGDGTLTWLVDQKAAGALSSWDRG